MPKYANRKKSGYGKLIYPILVLAVAVRWYGPNRRRPISLASLRQVYIISMDSRRLINTAQLVRQLGIPYELVPAVPSYRDEVNSYAVKYLGANNLHPHSAIAKAIGLVLSHRNSLSRFARTRHEETDWALILEDDIAFYEQIPANSTLLQKLLVSGMKTSKNTGFFYLGLCAPECTGKEVISPDNNVSIQRCWGQCTHAYVVSKMKSKTIFQEVMKSAVDTANYWPGRYHMDLLYKHYFSILPVPRRPFLVGANLQMKEPYTDWFGVCFQNRWNFPSTLGHNDAKIAL